MRWVINYNNKKYTLKYIIALISLIIFDTASIVYPLLLGAIVDNGLKKHNKELVVNISIFLIIFVIIKTLGSYISIIKLSKTCIDINNDIRNDCYKKLNEMDDNFYRKYNPGELMTIITSDTFTLRRIINNVPKRVIAITLSFIIALIYCLKTNIPLTIIILLPTTFICYFSIQFIKYTKPLYKKLREETAVVNNYIRDNIEGNKVVKAFSMEKDEISNMERLNEEYTKKKIEVNYKGIETAHNVRLFARMMTVFCVCFGGLFLMNNYITIGQLIVFISLVAYLKSPFETIFDLLDQMQNFSISKSRVISLLEEKPTIIHNGTKKLDTLLCNIEFKDVGLSVKDRTILEHINLNIKPGSTIALIGPTGSGKSTIINLLLGFVEPTRGEILINGINIKDISIAWLREKIGYVSGEPFLFSDTISSNIKYGNLKLSNKDMEHFAHIAKLDYVNELDERYETVIGERGVGLSGGEKQRLSIARALAVKPNLLILDDVTSALDMETELEITSNLKNLDFPCTKIIIAGKIVSVKDADIIYVVDNHTIIEQGTHRELLKNKGYYYEIYKIQNSKGVK